MLANLFVSLPVRGELSATWAWGGSGSTLGECSAVVNLNVITEAALCPALDQ